MKKITNANIGGRSFVMDEDAYERLERFLAHFRQKVDALDANEVQNDLEARIAELFTQEILYPEQVVTLAMVNRVAARLGMPDGSAEDNNESFSDSSYSYSQAEVRHRIYRDVEHKQIAGVCSGLAAYFDIDPALIRIIMVVLLLTGSVGFWLYIIVWIVAPKAITPIEKCELRGWPVTPENLAKFTTRK